MNNILKAAVIASTLFTVTGCSTAYTNEANQAKIMENNNKVKLTSKVNMVDKLPMHAGDEFHLYNAQIQGDTLNAHFAFAGGCKPHEFVLNISSVFQESFPAQTRAVIVHKGMGDACESFIDDHLTFDLKPLSDDYKKSYQTDHGSMYIYLNDIQAPILYTF